MKVVVTGATGNIGTALLRTLAHDGWHVVGVARRRPNTARAPYRSVHWVEVDVGSAAAVPALSEACTGADAVVHLAWAVHPRTDDPPAHRTNVTGSANVLAATAAAGVPHLVCASSAGAYAPADRWRRVTEDWPCTGVPGSLYSAHKAALESQLDTFTDAHPHLRVARIRPCGVAQPDAAAELASWLLSPWLPRTALGHRWLPLPLWPGLRLQVVHADDVARAIRLALTATATGPFNLAAEPLLNARDLAAAMRGVRLPVPLPVLRGAAWAAWRAGLQPLHPGWLRLADRASLVDPTRAREQLGWTPHHHAADVVTELVEAIRDRRHGPGPPLRPSRRIHFGHPTHQDQTPSTIQ